jgi:hypothetical protein
MRWALPAVAVGLVLALPASAGAATADVVTLLTNGYVDQSGLPLLYDDSSAKFGVGPTYTDGSDDISVTVTGKADSQTWNFQFAAPQGQKLQPGVYDGAQRAAFRKPGRPGLDLNGATCDNGGGRFDVKDIARDAAGNVQRLWILYEARCEGAPDATYGEVRLGEPVADDAVIASPSTARWPENDLGRVDPPSPVYFLAPAGGLKPTATSVAGPNASEFTVTADECKGKTVAAGASCRVLVRFAPSAAGTRTATLRLTDAAGRTAEVPLQGWDHGGTTRLTMQSDAGDFIGAGKTYDYTPANARFSIEGSAQLVSWYVRMGDTWAGELAPSPGGALAPGRFAPAARYPYNDGNAGLDVHGAGRGCNVLTGEFTVTDASFKEYGIVRSFAATFEQHCEGAAPALRGTFSYRVGDDAKPAPWMAGGTAATPAPGPATPGSSGPAPGGGGPDPCSASAFAAARVRPGTTRSNRIRGSRAAEVIRAGAGNDTVRAGGGNDCVDGGSGRDRIDGGAGADVLVGGAGRDVLICGSGRDMAIVGKGDRTRGCEVKVRVKP